MWISELRIRGYKSFYDATIHPKQLSILVGPNNSGKSNLVDCIEFLSDTYRHGIEFALTRKGGYENVAWRRQRRTKRPLKFGISARLATDDLSYRVDREAQQQQFEVEHDFEIGAVGSAVDAEFRVVAEHLSLSVVSGRRTRKLLDVTRLHSQNTIQVRESRTPLKEFVRPFDQEPFRQYLNEAVRPTQLFIEYASFNVVVDALVRSIARWRLFQLSPLECRRSGVPTPNADIDRHGGNLPGLIRFLRQSPVSWRSTISSMQQVVPRLKDVDTTYTTDRRLTLQFHEEGAGRPWGVHEVSDGTVQTLALFAILADQRNTLLAIEEPENSVHPWIIKSFVNACREASDKQIFVTTHSPALLEVARPEEVSVVWREQHKSYVKPLLQLDPDADRSWQSGELSVYELLDTGIVRQSVPGGLS